jgi:hypothetical protein
MAAVTQWFYGGKPKRIGVYEVGLAGFGCQLFSHWDGVKWCRIARSVRGAASARFRAEPTPYSSFRWRGLADKGGI